MIELYFGFTVAAILLTCLCFKLKKKGFSFWRKYFVTKLFIYFQLKIFKKKLNLYQNLKNSRKPLDVGLIPTSLEYATEKPCKKPKFCDGIHFLGMDASRNMIDLSINKVQENLANVWLLLKLSSDHIYKLPMNLDTRTAYIDNENFFQSSGLQIKCLSPLRKWRISFNGLLKKCKSPSDENEGEIVHVKFSFIWLAMSVVQELNSNFNLDDLAVSIANEKAVVDEKQLLRFEEFQRKYEQWGQLMGTATIGGKDQKELYLWSCRTRFHNNAMWNMDILNSKFYMYLQDGFPLKIESLTIANCFSNFTSGYSISGLGASENISHISFSHHKFVQEKVRKKLEFSFVKTKIRKSVNIQFSDEEIVFDIGPKLEQKLLLKPFQVTLSDGDSGFGILHLVTRSNQESEFKEPIMLLKDAGSIHCEKMIVLLQEKQCISSELVGGKGCSLGLLTSLAAKTHEFEVPKGFVVTTNAFKKHIESNLNVKLAVQKLKQVSCQKNVEDLQRECSKCIEVFKSSSLCEDLIEEIKKTLSYLYDSFDSVRFSIRSSAFGEDSEDLSAAGQMLTVLGVHGLSNILNSIIECWSSKFSFEAVQYSRQNGQPLMLPMAVVVQEMIPSEVSGVLFTHDPVTGDPNQLCITANYGLGETVVSSLAEPDTFKLKRSSKNSLTVFEKCIGSKKTQVHMKDGDGTEKKHFDSDFSLPCLSDELAVKIGNIGILLEKSFCSPRDIEWAYHKSKLFLLQARPITTLHTETDFELIHDQDTPVRSDYEFWTRANTGEVFLGATTPLTISVVVAGMDIYSHRNQAIREFKQFCPYFFHVLPVTHKQVTISLIDTLFRNNEKEVTNNQKSFEVSLFGRLVSTKEMHAVGIKRNGYIAKPRKLFYMGFLYKAGFSLPNMVKKVHDMMDSCAPCIENFTNIENTWQGIMEQFTFFSEASNIHGLATFLSSFYNMLVLNTLAKKRNEWDSVLFSDFAALLSSCNKIESADVPASLQELSKTIAVNYGETFASLPANTAYDILKNDDGNMGKLFRDFLKKHGHRCVKEFDLHSVSWGMVPETLIPIIQNMVGSPDVLKFEGKEKISVEAAISKLKTPLSSTSKFLLKTVLPWSRNAVGQREKTKSMLIKSVDWFRQLFYHLGNLMVQEGMLPDDELIFFLSLEEIKEMIDYRMPGLVSKAIRRRRLHPMLNALQFPEIIKGIPKPIRENTDDSVYEASFVLKGTPVCQGKVKAKVTVVLSLDEACHIKSGDILITHSTDIGWSPYFPLLSGVVTVLGGLISHGAVVAREYGLPCVVGVQNATSAFKSGDIVILDGTNGTVTKVAS